MSTLEARSTPSPVTRAIATDVLANVGRAILGKEQEVRLCLASILCGGHLLIEDVPGVGKTMLAKSLARSLDCTFKRIQFTPDLLPSDVTGVTVFNQKSLEFEFKAGPLFAQVVLADEINRATPKTQAALLEAMEERQVTVDGDTKRLPTPFLVMATQNPVEYAGTFPLPEAQLDRFMMRVSLGYLDAEAEAALLGRLDRVDDPFVQLQPVVSAAQFRSAQGEIAAVHVAHSLRGYVARLVEATRHHPEIALGASTRGTINLYRTAQAWAAIEGRDYVVPDDIKLLAEAVLAHRLILRPSAEIHGHSARRLVADILDTVAVPQVGADSHRPG